MSELSCSVEVRCLEAKSENVVSLVKMTEETELGAVGIDSSILGGVGAGAASIIATGFQSDAEQEPPQHQKSTAREDDEASGKCTIF